MAYLYKLNNKYNNYYILYLYNNCVTELPSKLQTILPQYSILHISGTSRRGARVPTTLFLLKVLKVYKSCFFFHNLKVNLFTAVAFNVCYR